MVEWVWKERSEVGKDFPPVGLIYLWFMNDECRDDHIDWQIAEFAKAGVTTVCLHPRGGLLLPYGGKEWFEFFRRTVEKCAKAGLGVWIYDEDGGPSGGAGGWIILEHPEHVARAIECFEAEPDLKEGDLFCFPGGKLLWAGIVPHDDAPEADDRYAIVDLTGRVGILRREWKVEDKWDSRFYYPATPLYVCPRAGTYSPEFALKAPRIPDGMKLVAFVARPFDYPEYASAWGALHDSLSPEVTQLFIERTYEQYHDAVGDMFGGPITAMFIDEPKYYGSRPWTAGMFENFAETFGYDLRPRLYDLFSNSESPRAVQTRLNYREWCGRRFEEAWLKPVSEWCHSHNLKLVGHISPEDEPVEQAHSLSNLFPLHKHFDLPGLDLIIPAVGDADHPLINVGITMAASAAQQQEKVGVMSELLGASGLDLTAEQAAKIINWQVVMGATTPAIHAIFSSTEGNRLFDAPPDFGPKSSLWEGMQEIDRSIRQIQGSLIGATQAAPVAILWPIRSFQVEAEVWQAEPGGMRGELLDLLYACLSHQVGTHLLDEEDLWDAPCSEGKLSLGRAEYSFVLVPTCKVLHRRSLEKLRAASEEGVTVYLAGDAPIYQQTEREVEAVDFSWCKRVSIADLVQALPRLTTVEGEGSDEIRCTSWVKGGAGFSLLINIGESDWEGTVNGQKMALPVGRIHIIEG